MVPEVLNRGGGSAATTALGVGGARRKLGGELRLGSPAGPPPKTPTLCSEIYSGRLALVDAGGLRVAVKVHRTTSEHFALVFPDKVHVCKPIGFVNLKNCRVELSAAGCVDESEQRTLQIVQRSCDGDKLTLRADTALDAKRCAEAMRSKQQEHQSSSGPGSVASPALSPVSRFREDCSLAKSTLLPNILEEGDEE